MEHDIWNGIPIGSFQAVWGFKLFIGNANDYDQRMPWLSIANDFHISE